jgi:hypothetical protein
MLRRPKHSKIEVVAPREEEEEELMKMRVTSGFITLWGKHKDERV